MGPLAGGPPSQPPVPGRNWFAAKKWFCDVASHKSVVECEQLFAAHNQLRASCRTQAAVVRKRRVFLVSKRSQANGRRNNTFKPGAFALSEVPR